MFLIFANVVYTGVFHLSSSQVRQLYSSEWFKLYMKIVILFFFFIFILIFVDMLVILHKKNLLWSSVNAFFILLNLYFFFQYLPILRKSVKKFNFKFLLILRGISNFISGEDSTILKFLFFTSLQMSASADALNSLFADRWSLLIW